MVSMRLKRMGKKKAPFYRIVATDSRVKRDGEYIELLGTYDPLKGKIIIDHEKCLKWLKNGAQPTNTIRSILSNEGILKQFHEEKLKIAKENKSKKAPKKVAVKKVTTAKKAPKKVVPKAVTKKTDDKVVKSKAVKKPTATPEKTEPTS